MYGVFVICKVKPGKGEAFHAAALRDRVGSRTEAGNLRFDILAPEAPNEPGEPEVYYLFEIYRSKEEFTAHQQTPHFLLFREETKDLMAEPRQSFRYSPVDSDPWE